MGLCWSLHQRTYFAKPIKGTVKNSVGAGDSMVAGFTGEYVRSQDPIEALNGELLAVRQQPFQMIWQVSNLLRKLMKKLR